MTPHTPSAALPPVQISLSQTLATVSAQLPEDAVSVRDLLRLIGEQGMLFLCIILVIPFLTPIPIPGVSTVFGMLIMLISFGVIINRVPWLPKRMLDRSVSSQAMSRVLEHGARLFARFERLMRPRLLYLTRAGASRINGALLFLAGLLLIVPLPVIPFSNMLPGLAILCLAVGMLQRDGVFVILGWLLIAVTIIYFAAIAVGILAAGGSLMSLFSEAAVTAPPGS